MADASDEYLARKMSRAEYWILSEDERKERLLAQNRIGNSKYREDNRDKEKARHKKFKEENPEKRKEYDRKYIEKNPEKVKESNRLWQQSPAGKKSTTLSAWKTSYGLQETPEEMERIYILSETQELCSSCGVKLTRTGKHISTDAYLDHSHETNRFRQICCKKCNDSDNWKKFWVDGIYGGTKVPRGPP